MFLCLFGIVLFQCTHLVRSVPINEIEENEDAYEQEDEDAIIDRQRRDTSDEAEDSDEGYEEEDEDEDAPAERQRRDVQEEMEAAESGIGGKGGGGVVAYKGGKKGGAAAGFKVRIEFLEKLTYFFSRILSGAFSKNFSTDPK